MASLAAAAAKPRTAVDKLLRCQQILGYKFKDIQLLQQSLHLPQNKRLATAGDTYLNVAMVDRWFARDHLSSDDFSTIKTETVSNSALSMVGFSRGLSFCTTPECRTIDHMSTTVEAILAAVYRDALFEDGTRKAADWDLFESVIARLGINHPLIASTSDLRWALDPMPTTRKIPYQFFSKGHHMEWTRVLLTISGTIAPSRSIRIDSQGDRAAVSPGPLAPRVPDPRRPAAVDRTSDTPTSADTRPANTESKGIWNRLKVLFRGDPRLLHRAPAPRRPYRPSTPRFKARFDPSAAADPSAEQTLTKPAAAELFQTLAGKPGQQREKGIKPAATDPQPDAVSSVPPEMLSSSKMQVVLPDLNKAQETFSPSAKDAARQSRRVKPPEALRKAAVVGKSSPRSRAVASSTQSSKAQTSKPKAAVAPRQGVAAVQQSLESRLQEVKDRLRNGP